MESVVRVRVGDQTVLEEDVGSVGVYAMLPERDSMGSLVVLQSTPGGSACEALFRILDLGGETPRISDEFGSCGPNPDLSLLPDGVRLHFRGWLPPAVANNPDVYPNADAEPVTYEYGHGRLRQLR